MGMGGFAEGMDDGLKTYLNNQQNQEGMAFKLKLQNAQIEGQLANAKKLADYNSVDPNTSKTLREWSGIEQADGPMNAASASAALGMGKSNNSRAAAEERAKARQFKPTVYMRENKTIERTWTRDPETGQMVAKETALGVSPSAYAKYADFRTDSESVYAILDGIDVAAKKLLTDKNYVSRLFGSAEITLEKMKGSGRPEVVDLAARLESNSLAIAAVINRGRPSDTDKIAVQKGLVNTGDSLAYALQKTQALREIAERTDKNMYEMLIEGRMEPPKKDAGGHTDADFKAEDERRLKLKQKAEADKAALKATQQPTKP